MKFFWLGLILFTQISSAAIPPGSFTLMMPMNCAELLPDAMPFISFFNAVAVGLVKKDKALSRRVFKVLALRDKLNESSDRMRESNPVDTLIRKMFCFYREQKDPMRIVPFDDPDFIQFLRTSIKELESKVDLAILQWDIERQQRRYYEQQFKASEEVANRLQKEAQMEAEYTFDRLNADAKKKAPRP